MVASFAAAQTEFSAEIVDSKKAERGPTKVYFGKDKMRFDSPKSNAEGGGAILDFASRRLIVLMPPRHMYMEIPSQDMEKEGMMSFFRTGDVESACGDWLKLEENKGGTCRKVGNENVNGRSTVKYEGTNARGETGYVWLEPKLRFPVKWQGKNGDGEMRNIQEGPQPASLFEVPAGYTKFDMGGMTKRPQ
jgi:hypothetical protein